MSLPNVLPIGSSSSGPIEGTSIVWTELRNAYRGRDQDEARSWLSTRNEALRSHLGITFHRLLADGRLQIDVLVDEFGDAPSGPGFRSCLSILLAMRHPDIPVIPRI